MFRAHGLSVVAFASLFVLSAGAVMAQSFSRLELSQVSPPAGFENSLSFTVTYYQSMDGMEFEVFPTRADKEKDFDLILAQVVRRIIEQEYEGKKRWLDETDVKPASPQEIRKLVATDFLTPAWSRSAQKALSQYLSQHGRQLKLNKIIAYLDYQDEKGTYVSGIDVDPVLFRFGTGQQRDQATVIMIRQTDR